MGISRTFFVDCVLVRVCLCVCVYWRLCGLFILFICCPSLSVCSFFTALSFPSLIPQLQNRKKACQTQAPTLSVALFTLLVVQFHTDTQASCDTDRWFCEWFCESYHILFLLQSESEQDEESGGSLGSTAVAVSVITHLSWYLQQNTFCYCSHCYDSKTVVLITTVISKAIKRWVLDCLKKVLF